MKTFKYLTLAALSLFLCVSCQDSQLESEGTFDVVFKIRPDTETKTLLDGNVVKWEEGDKIGYYTPDAYLLGDATYGTVSIDNEGVASFTATFSKEIQRNAKIYAYFPYDGTYGTQNILIKTIADNQYGDFDAMPMISLPVSLGNGNTIQKETPIQVDLKFINLASAIQFYTYASDEAIRQEEVQQISFKASGNIAGTAAYLSIISSKPTEDEILMPLVPGTGKDSITVYAYDSKIGTDKNDAGINNMVLIPGSYTGTVTVKTNKAQYDFPISSAKTFNRSSIHPIGLNLSKEGVRKSRIQWMNGSEVFATNSTSDGKVNLPTENPSREGFLFGGWTAADKIEEDGSDVVYVENGDEVTTTVYRAVFVKALTESESYMTNQKFEYYKKNYTDFNKKYTGEVYNNGHYSITLDESLMYSGKLYADKMTVTAGEGKYITALTCTLGLSLQTTLVPDGNSDSSVSYSSNKITWNGSAGKLEISKNKSDDYFNISNIEITYQYGNSYTL